MCEELNAASQSTMVWWCDTIKHNVCLKNWWVVSLVKHTWPKKEN